MVGHGGLNGVLRSYARMVEATKMTGSHVTVGAPRYAYVASTSAYVLVPLTTTARVRGKPYIENRTLAFTLQRTPSGWRIGTQTWVKSTENFNPYGQSASRAR